MRKPSLILLFVVLVIAAVAAFIYRGRFQGSSDETTKLPEGLGTGVAEATAQLLGNQGKVVLFLPKRGSHQDPVVELQRIAFTKALTRNSGMSLLATESLETERPGTMGAGGLDPDQFRQLLQRHATADGFVSLAGFPEFAKEALPALQGRKFVVVSSPGPQLKALLQAGVVQVAIIPRMNPPTGGKKPGTAREWFSFAHETITPANAGTLP